MDNFLLFELRNFLLQKSGKKNNLNQIIEIIGGAVL